MFREDTKHGNRKTNNLKYLIKTGITVPNKQRTIGFTKTVINDYIL